MSVLLLGSNLAGLRLGQVPINTDLSLADPLTAAVACLGARLYLGPSILGISQQRGSG
jgi:hypothetical protein